MAVTKLDHPLTVKSVGGLPVKIIEIDPSSHDCFTGEITTANGVEPGVWDLGGLKRGGTDSVNLPMNTDVLSLLRQFARHLGAK